MTIKEVHFARKISKPGQKNKPSLGLNEMWLVGLEPKSCNIHTRWSNRTVFTGMSRGYDEYGKQLKEKCPTSVDDTKFRCEHGYV